METEEKGDGKRLVLSKKGVLEEGSYLKDKKKKKKKKLEENIISGTNSTYQKGVPKKTK